MIQAQNAHDQYPHRFRRWQRIKLRAKQVGGILLGVYMLSVFTLLTYRDCHQRPKLVTERSRLETTCRRGDRAACGDLLKLVDQPCRKKEQADACRRLAFLEAQGVVVWPNLTSSATHYGIACGDGDPLSCRVVHECIEKTVSFTQCEAAQHVITTWYGH